MYKFIDVNEVSEENILPSEALMINGDYIENLIEGYRTLQVTGREALSAELKTYESGVRDGSVLQSKRYPARYITVKYQLLAESPEAFRRAFNRLASILNVEEAELIFNDEPDKFFIGTPETIEEIPGGRNSVVGSFTIFCADPFKYSVQEYVARPEPGQNSFLIDYSGTYKSYPTLEAEFYNENEILAALTGAGDCGYVAFFNDNKKIIQMGDPEESFGTTHDRSQTLVLQKFESATSLNNIIENDWSNPGIVSRSDFFKTGNVGMKTASYYTTKAPTTEGFIVSAKSTDGKPNIKFMVYAQASNRTEKSVDVKLSITTSLDMPAVSTKATKNVTKGAKVTLNGTKIYVSSDAKSASGTKTGTYYLWDSSVINNRIRITNSASNAGKSGQVTGWVILSDIGFSSTSTTVSLGKNIILEGSVQIMGGDWHSVTLKSETAVWSDSSGHTAKLTIRVTDLESTTTLLENIKFKVEKIVKTYEDNNVTENTYTILDENKNICENLEISAYTAPVPSTWYLTPETYGNSDKWHGPSITRIIPADTAGISGAENFTFTYQHKMAIGESSVNTQEKGLFEALLVSGSGSNKKIVAGISIVKSKYGTNATLNFIVNGSVVYSTEKVIAVGDDYEINTASITKDGRTIKFNTHGIQKTFTNFSVANTEVEEITFTFAKYGTETYPALTYNGLYWVKFIKNNCDIYTDVPNKFSANDIVQANCKTGEIFLNNISTPSLGALGNDWEDFYLSPGLNQIGCSYSDWVLSTLAPNFRIKYREVFI